MATYSDIFTFVTMLCAVVTLHKTKDFLTQARKSFCTCVRGFELSYAKFPTVEIELDSPYESPIIQHFNKKIGCVNKPELFMSI